MSQGSPPRPDPRATLLTGLGVLVVLAIIVYLATRPAPGPTPTPTAVPTSAPTPSPTTAPPTTTPAPSITATTAARPTLTLAPSPSPDPAAAAVGAWKPPPATRTFGCQYGHGRGGALLPDPACTPGATNPELGVDKLCSPDFRTSDYRHVTQRQKDAAYARYGVTPPQPVDGFAEIDHLIPLESGGANNDTNLWPEMAGPGPGYHEKDLAERLSRDLICSGAMSLADVQRMIATDWTQLLPEAQRRGLQPKTHTDDDENDD